MKKESIWEVYYPTGVREDKRAIPLASFPLIFYFWPTMLTFFTCGLLQNLEWASPVTLGWWTLGIFAFNLVVAVYDLDQKKFVILLLGLIVLGLALWISSMKGLPILGAAADWLGSLTPQFSNHAYWLLGCMFVFFFLIGLIQPRFDYWRFEPNEFVHYVQPWGRDQSIPRQGSTVTKEIPDILEMLLSFGGGTLVIRREGDVVARIRHVPFLTRRMIAIERMLSAMRVRTVDAGEQTR